MDLDGQPVGTVDDAVDNLNDTIEKVKKEVIPRKTFGLKHYPHLSHQLKWVRCELWYIPPPLEVAAPAHRRGLTALRLTMRGGGGFLRRSCNTSRNQRSYGQLWTAFRDQIAHFQTISCTTTINGESNIRTHRKRGLMRMTWELVFRISPRENDTSNLDRKDCRKDWRKRKW